MFDAAAKKEEILREAKNVMTGYPNGADYFELAKCYMANQVVYYYFTGNPNKTDFSKFRTPEYTRNVKLDVEIE
ncbi:MAG: hypothetical protein RRA32_10145 [bacterium]|nr:hypothetical protein [bacterium]